MIAITSDDQENDRWCGRSCPHHRLTEEEVCEMYATIVWATDGSDGADAALDEALRLAEQTGGRIVAVHCDQRLLGRSAAWPVLADEDDRRVKIRRQVADLHAEGVDVELVMRRSHREAADVVAEITAEAGGDVIVCGTRGLRALPGAFLGSFTFRLLHVAPCPVLAIREGERERPVRRRVKAKVGA